MGCEQPRIAATRSTARRNDSFDQAEAEGVTMTLKALVFDFDGTIADTEETHRQAFNYAFVRFGLGWEWTKPMYRELLKVSGGKERIAHYVSTLRVPAADKARLARLVPAIHAAKTELYVELVGDGRCPLRPGIERLLDEACGRALQIAIASTSSLASINALLGRQVAGRCRFTAIACAEHVEAKKPAPDVYRLALAMLGRGAERCVAFEDSANGLRAAKAAGLYTIVTPSQWTEGDDFGEADLVLPHLGDAGHPLPLELIGKPWLDVDALVARNSAALRSVG
jgi:HAD superfamily hydrolase (TIGR01509 family)